MNTLITIAIIVYIIGVIIAFKLHIDELGMWMLNPIILTIVIIISLGSWLSVLFIKISD